MRLWSQRNTRLTGIDLRRGADGPEFWSVVAEQSGDTAFRVVCCSKESKAAWRSASRRTPYGLEPRLRSKPPSDSPTRQTSANNPQRNSLPQTEFETTE